MQNLHNIPKSVPYQSSYCCVNIHICYCNHEYLHGYCKCVYYYFINFFSHLYSHQSLFPHILSTPPNHHSITTTTTHHNPRYSNHKINQKQRKINPNPKSNLQWKTQQLRTQNQTFNKKPINPNPNSNRSRRHHYHGELAAAIREERNKCLRTTTKEKIKK